ncbi:histidine kinase 1 [Purpureocillium lavendulum]|uniref:histidine kinase n=1 Tax=Purpureocillium lavendulum TaxID=1247861 RepID=A0AB34FKV4_9HYPO|nr:histidine kinase 1 [Purpureocillium lavendulum]
MANNLTTQVRDIVKVTTAVAKGDLTQKVQVDCNGEILELKSTINSMVDQLQQFAREVTKIAKQVGTEGRLGGQATIHNVQGTWRDFTETVNSMAMNLTTQVRVIARATTAVAKGKLTDKISVEVKGAFALEVRAISAVTQAIANGDMSKTIDVEANGEIQLLKETINMVRRLWSFCYEVQRVAKDVGVHGKMGAQADVLGLDARWKEITTDVNTMASNLVWDNSQTTQVRAFSDITHLATDGDFSKLVDVEASGEMHELKQKINKMISNLKDSVQRNTQARGAAELANKTKSEFLANMSHEIRTPMNGIIGMTQLTLDADLTQYQREMLNIVDGQASSLFTIIDDILDLSKIEVRRMVLEEIPYTLRGTVFNSLKTLAVKANEKSLDLTFRVDSSVPDYVIGDSFRLRQVIMNLVGNAIKFTEHGRVSLTIRGSSEASQMGPRECAVEFVVEDTGIGIREDKLDLIFESFQQADGSMTRKFGGTGLGLSISKRLLNLMGGDISVSSEAAKGSRFAFTCRVRTASSGAEFTEKMLKPYHGHQVLIDKALLKSAVDIERMLRQLGLRPVSFSYEDRLIPAHLKPNDILPEDCDAIPVQSMDTARRLRVLDELKYLPVVLLAPMVPVDVKASLELGISSYMTTPSQLVDLGNSMVPALVNKATPASVGDTRILKILLAEDNTINQRLAVNMLQKYHHTVTVVANGLEAVEAVKEKQFDVVLMDIQMPMMVITRRWYLLDIGR